MSQEKDQVEEKKLEAKTEVKKTETKSKQSKYKYYTSKIAGLAIQVGESQSDHPERPDEVRFQPYYERYQGDRIRVGYLRVEADRSKVVKLLEADYNVKEISKKEFEEATQGEESEKAPL